MENLEKIFKEYLEKDKKDKNFDNFKENIVENFQDNIKIINKNLVLNTYKISEKFIIFLVKTYRSFGFKNLVVLVDKNTISKEWQYIYKVNNVIYLDRIEFDTISQSKITASLLKGN